MPGSFVYAIAWSKDGPTKVGVAHSVTQRLATLQTSHPYRLRIYCAAEVPSEVAAFAIELTVLKELRDERLMGEWVLLPPQELTACIKRAVVSRKIRWRPLALDGRAVAGNPQAQRICDAYDEARRLYQEIGGMP